VLLRVLVLLGEAQREGADAGAEEGVLGGDELAGARAARERAGLVGAVQVDGEGTPTRRMPRSSKAWPSHQPSWV
jgi:hypothetical protein